MPVADEWHEDLDRHSLVRELRQHLESLARAGLDRIPGSSARPFMGLSAPPARRRALASDPRSDDPGVIESRGEGNVMNPRVEAAPAGSASAGIGTSDVPAMPPPVLPVPSLAVLFGSAGFDQPPVPACDRPAMLAGLASEVAVCRRCPHLADTRTQTVFGVGKTETRLMFIGEAPGADEDRLGEPFVGRAGQLLTDMITKGMGLSRDQVYIANVLKCRPPENRTPTIDEANNCFPYLEQQIAIIRPEFLCLLGKVAAQAVLNTTQAIGRLRGKWHRYRGIPTLATYHPSYLLRTPSAKKDAWEDLQILMKEMGIVRPGK
jgi:uracil-DNA glycosylase family 4